MPGAPGLWYSPSAMHGAACAFCCASLLHLWYAQNHTYKTEVWHLCQVWCTCGLQPLHFTPAAAEIHALERETFKFKRKEEWVVPNVIWGSVAKWSSLWCPLLTELASCVTPDPIIHTPEGHAPREVRKRRKRLKSQRHVWRRLLSFSWVHVSPTCSRDRLEPTWSCWLSRGAFEAKL